jgi:chromosomal replication initiator protein
MRGWRPLRFLNKENVDNMLATALSSEFSLTSPWEACLEYISGKIGPGYFETWFRTTDLAVGEDGRARVQVPNRFFADFMEEHFTDVIREALKECGVAFASLAFEPVARDWEVAEAVAGEIVEAQIREVPKAVVVKGGQRFHPDYVFDKFVVGDSNRMAHAAALAVAQAPGKTKFNPLIVYGGTGLGKTHLLQAIGHFAEAEGTADNVVYMTSEEFTREYMKFLAEEKDSISFSMKFSGVDLLLIDDIQFFSKKEGTQKQFSLIFDRLLRESKQIVLSSDRMPNRIPDMMEHIISRFACGLSADIQPPNLETRMAILRQKAEFDGLHLPNEVLQYVAGHITSNVRELEGTLTRLIASSSFKGTDITIDIARELCGDAISSREERLSVKFIMQATAAAYGVTANQLSAHTRKKEVALPRSVAMYLCRKWTKQSTITIGLEFGGRNHSTVLHAEKKIEADLNNEEETELRRMVAVIEEQLKMRI